MKDEVSRNFLGEEPTYKKGGKMMKTKMKKLMKNQKGMTLIELLAVIVIIAVIALIAIPAIGNIINNSKDKAILSDAQNIVAGAKIAIQDDACTSENKCTNSDLQNYVDLDSNDSKLDYGVEVSKDNSGKTIYKVYYSEFTNLKNSKYSSVKTATTSTAATEISNINKLLGKKASEEPKKEETKP